ncbi:hypothetical protein C0992_009849 [Termitomyces sp. T32_za158]|nr:hypothetical protein C0992_009849 [Termitomyces sp. T32_za158]
MVATENYPSWYSKHIGHPTKVKTEAPAEDQQVLHILKRSAPIPLASEEPATKKIKSSNPTETSLEPAVTLTSTTEKENIAPLLIVNPLAASDPSASLATPTHANVAQQLPSSESMVGY